MTASTARRRALTFGAPALSALAVICVWEAYTRIGDVRPLLLPRPSRIVGHIVDNPGFYWSNTVTTAGEALLGLLLGFTAAALIATAMAHSELAERLSWPLIVVIQSTPIVVIAPLFLLWFGIGLVPKVLVVALFVFVPFVTNILAGLRSADPNLIELARSVDASTFTILRRIRAPQAMADTLAAARIAVPLALVGAVIGEFYGGSTSGLGYHTRTALARLDVDVAWGSIIVLALVGMLGTFAVLAAERRILHWHPSHRPASGS